VNLQFPSPQAFAQSVRQRLDNLPSSVAIAIVEGGSDKQSLVPFMHPTARIVAAHGKEMVLGAKAFFTPDELMRLAMIVDCDGQSNPEWFDDDLVIVSSARDIDADFVIYLGAFESVLVDFVAKRCDSSGETTVEVEYWRAFTCALSSRFGVVLDTARRLGKPVKISDSQTRLRRRVRLIDMPEVDRWIAQRYVPSMQEVVRAMAATVGWGRETQDLVLSQSLDGGGKLCRLHDKPNCDGCMPRRFSNGHDLVDLVSRIATFEGGFEVSPAEIARAFRMSRHTANLNEWSVYRRLKARETTIGRPLLAG
jgi:hypothetical protein